MIDISPVVADLPPSGIRAFFDLVLTMDDIVSLGVGEPDYHTPWHISHAAIRRIEEGYTTYTSNSGLLELRTAISDYLDETYRVRYDPKEEILITVGVSEGMDLALRTLIVPGDEVVVVDPSYVAYAPLVTLAGGVPRRIRTTREGNFKLTPEALDRVSGPRTRALLFNYPANPTGTTYTRSELEALARVIHDHDLAVISDEIYHQLSFDHAHTALSSLPGMRERVILLNGFSKGYAMTGWRVGFACAPAPLVAAMTKIHQYAIMCVPTMGQFAAVEALKNGEDDVREMKAEYQRRRNFVVHRLNEIGLSCHRPGGTFYVFPKVPDRFESGLDFANRLLKETRVAVVPGSAFGEERHIRISYASSMHNLEIALKRMESFVRGASSPKIPRIEKSPSGQKV